MISTVPIRQLNEVAEINPGITESVLFNREARVSFVSMSSVSEVTAGVTNSVERAASECLKGYTPFRRDDVLVAKITPCFENGKIVIANIPHEFGFGSTEFHVVRPRGDELHSRYLLHALRRPEFRLQGEKRMTGSAGQRRVPADFLSTFHIPLPPFSSQKRIAEILDRAEALRAKRRAALAQLDTITQSIFLDLVQRAERTGSITKPLGDYLTFVTSGGRGWARYYAPSGTRFVRSLDVQMNYIGNEDVAYVQPPDNAEARRTRICAGDVLLTITGSRIGRVSSVPAQLADAYISQHVAILRVDKTRIDPGFLSFFLSSRGQRQIEKAQYGQTKPGLNFEQIRRFQIPCPPLPLQHEFARRAAAVEKLKTAHRQSLAELDALFASLQHRAFRGEL